MGVDFYKCDNCGDCTHSDNFRQCRSCDNKLNFCNECDEENIINVEDVNFIRYEKNTGEKLEYDPDDEGKIPLCDDCIKEYYYKYDPNSKREPMTFSVNYQSDINHDGKYWKNSKYFRLKFKNDKWGLGGGIAEILEYPNEKSLRTDFIIEKDEKEPKTMDEYNDVLYKFVTYYTRSEKRKEIKNISFNIPKFNFKN